MSLVQEEPVEPLVEIVMMRDVPPRDPGMARAPGQSAESASPEIAEPSRRSQGIGPEAGEGQVKKVADIAPLDDEASLHVHLADRQTRIERDRAQR